MEPKVIFEDDSILVIDKPPGMTVNTADTTRGERTVQDWVQDYLKVSKEGKVPKVPKGVPFDTSDTFAAFDTFFARAGIVHRLDKETSGVLIVAKTVEAFVELQRQFKERLVEKTYVALVHGFVKPEEGEISVPVGRLPWNRKRFGIIAEGRESSTMYKVIEYLEVGSEKLEAGLRSGKWESHISHQHQASHITSHTSFSLLELRPKTGRTHQIRVHLKYLGSPIVSDLLYGGRKQARSDRKVLARMFLHATSIQFTHPTTKEVISFESKLSSDLQSFLSLCKKLP